MEFRLIGVRLATGMVKVVRDEIVRRLSRWRSRERSRDFESRINTTEWDQLNWRRSEINIVTDLYSYNDLIVTLQCAAYEPLSSLLHSYYHPSL